jgi:hypothetical protein
MQIHAYVLAADPCWLEASILSYYDVVQKIVISYDQEHKGFSGNRKLPVEACLRRLRAVDHDNKMVFSPGVYARSGHTAMENETHQRECAVREAGENADWVLQLDNDEVLPRFDALAEVLEYAAAMDIPAVEWPMRVLFRTTTDGHFLEVCNRDGSERFEYPGAICVRPNTLLAYGRAVSGSFVRPVVVGDWQSLQVTRPSVPNEYRIALENPDDAILHNSWARSPSNIRLKLASWGHNEGWKTWMFYYLRWLPSKYLWKWTRNFHPFSRGLWPALKMLDSLPPSISIEHARRTG